MGPFAARSRNFTTAMSAATPAADNDFAPTLHEPRLTELPALASAPGGGLVPAHGDEFTPAPGDDRAPAPGDDLSRGRSMQRSLRRLLDRVPGSRSALPHLAALEGALGQLGAQAVDQVSAHSLAKMLAQLRVLPLDPADGPIQDLFALVQRVLRPQARERREHQLSPHDPQSTVIITEGSESDFMNALAEARGGRSGH